MEGAEGPAGTPPKSLLEVKQKAVELGKSMNLDGKDLRKFVDETVEAEKIAMQLNYDRQVLKGKMQEMEEKRLMKERELANAIEKEKINRGNIKSINKHKNRKE